MEKKKKHRISNETISIYTGNENWINCNLSQNHNILILERKNEYKCHYDHIYIPCNCYKKINT